jgi:excinuclease UvrABC nuclease subunit
MPDLNLTWSKLKILSSVEVQKIPEGGGVYRLSYDPGGGKRYVFYVGSSNDIKSKILEHIKNSEENVCIKNYMRKYLCFFRYALIENEEQRSGVERQLYLKFRPKCNFQEPQGSPITINFY